MSLIIAILMYIKHFYNTKMFLFFVYSRALFETFRAKCSTRGPDLNDFHTEPPYHHVNRAHAVRAVLARVVDVAANVPSVDAAPASGIDVSTAVDDVKLARIVFAVK